MNSDSNLQSIAQATSPSRRTRFSPLLVILAVAAAIIWQLHFGGLTIFKPILDLYLAIAIANLAIYVWLRAWSGMQVPSQLLLGFGALIFQLILISLFRIDGFDGTGRIIAKWKWEPTPEQNLASLDFDWADAATVEIEQPGVFDSPSFRGSRRNGVFPVQSQSLDLEKSTLVENWRRPIGRGWSSFAAIGQFFVTQEQLNETESITCYQTSSGRLLWRHDWKARFEEYTSGPGPRATPAIAANRVIAFGGAGDLICLNVSDGSLLWSRKLCQREEDEILFGFSSSPLVYQGQVFVTPGYPNSSFVAVDMESGAINWSADNRKAGYSSPCLFEHDSGVSVLLFDATGLHAYDTESGQRQWTFPWGDASDEQVNVCQPAIVDQEHVLISSGYGRGTALLQVQKSRQQKWDVKQIWCNRRLKSKFASLIVHQEHVYGLDEGILTCLDLKTGNRRWKGGRYGHGQLILFGDQIIVQCESGQLAFVETNPMQFVELKSLNALTDRTWNHPVVVRDQLLIRNDREAACFRFVDPSPEPASMSD